LLAWMNDNGMAAEALRWTEKLPAEKTTNPPAAIEIANALTLQKSWTRLRRWTRNGSWSEYEYLRLAYRAYAVRQTRQSSADAEFGSLWRAADRASEENPEREIRLARLASKWNLPTEAEQLWLRVAQNPLTRREALDALFDIYPEEKKLLQEAPPKAQSIQTVEPATQAPAPSPSATANAMPSPAPVDLSPR